MSEWNDDMSAAPRDEMLLVTDVYWPPALHRDEKPPIKVGYICESSRLWRIFGASWSPTHWMRLPEPPSKPSKAEVQ